MATEVARQFFRCLGGRYRDPLFYSWRSSRPRPKAEPWGTDPQGSVLGVVDRFRTHLPLLAAGITIQKPH